MLEQINKVIKDCLTGIDGETYDPARIYLAAGVAVFLGNAVLALIHGQTWNAQDFGLGFGALLAAGGAGIALKAKTEPAK